MNNAKALVGISALIGGASIGIVTLIALFSPANIAVAAWVVAPLCAMGIVFGLLLTRSARH